MILLYPNYAKKSRQQSRILPQAQHKHRHIIPDPAPTAAYGIRKYLLCDLLRILFFQCLYHIPHPLPTAPRNTMLFPVSCSSGSSSLIYEKGFSNE